jgi:hypothetical protein
MLKVSRFLVTCILLVAIGFSLERQAYAYVDPGSGLFVVQSIGTALAGVLFYFRRRLSSLIRRYKTAETPAEVSEAVIDEEMS